MLSRNFDFVTLRLLSLTDDMSHAASSCFSSRFVVIIMNISMDDDNKCIAIIYCNMAARGLTDIFARPLRARSARGRVRIYQ